MDYSNFFRKCLFSSFLFVLALDVNANQRIREFETARLKSTAGTGVGSVLLNESAILNPASVAFFNFSTFFIQRGQQELAESNGRDWSQDQYNEESGNTAVIIADATNPNMKGTMSYVNQQDGPLKRKRISAAFGKPIDKKTSIGILYNYTMDKELLNPGDEGPDSLKTHQFGLGVIHAIDETFTLGVVANDVTKQIAGESNVLMGFQYFYRQIVSLMFDFGVDPYSDTIS